MQGLSLETGLYAPAIVNFSNELDKYKKAIYLYSCHQRLIGRSTVIIRPKLVTLLALYLQHGYERSTRELAANILGRKIEAINSMNLELRNLGLLIKDTRNSRINHLCEDLKELKTYLNNENPDQAFILFRLGREQRK